MISVRQSGLLKTYYSESNADPEGGFSLLGSNTVKWAISYTSNFKGTKAREMPSRSEISNWSADLGCRCEVSMGGVCSPGERTAVTLLSWLRCRVHSTTVELKQARALYELRSYLPKSEEHNGWVGPCRPSLKSGNESLRSGMYCGKMWECWATGKQ